MLLDGRLLERARVLTLAAFAGRVETRNILLVRVPAAGGELVTDLRRAFGRGVPAPWESEKVVDFQTVISVVSTHGTDLSAHEAAAFGMRELEDWVGAMPCFPVPLVERSEEQDGRICVGRSRSSDLSLRVSGVSKHHAVFERDGDGALWLFDADSRNGTFVQGERLAAGERVKMRRGTEIRFASVVALHCPPDLFWSLAQEG